MSMSWLRKTFSCSGPKSSPTTATTRTFGEIAGRQGKISGGAAENIFHAARRRGDVIECNRTDYENAHSESWLLD